MNSNLSFSLSGQGDQNQPVHANAGMNQADKFQVTSNMDITTYYKTISAKGKAVMREKRGQGETMHLAPLGYKNARDELGRSILVPDPETYKLVQEAKRLRAKGMSIRKICKDMTEKGLRSQRGKRIGPSSMLFIVSDTSVGSKLDTPFPLLQSSRD